MFQHVLLAFVHELSPACIHTFVAPCATRATRGGPRRARPATGCGGALPPPFVRRPRPPVAACNPHSSQLHLRTCVRLACWCHGFCKASDMSPTRCVVGHCLHHPRGASLSPAPISAERSPHSRVESRARLPQPVPRLGKAQPTAIAWWQTKQNWMQY